MIELEFKRLPIVLQNRIINIAVELDVEVYDVFDYLNQNTTEDIYKLRGKSLKVLRQKIQSN